jgi:hypothetical protein
VLVDTEVDAEPEWRIIYAATQSTAANESLKGILVEFVFVKFIRKMG